MEADGRFVNWVTAEQLIQGRPCGKEAARHTRPIAPGPSAKSSAPLGHRNYRELFYFLAHSCPACQSLNEPSATSSGTTTRARLTLN
jgi:hypothetical protein